MKLAVCFKAQDGLKVSNRGGEKRWRRRRELWKTLSFTSLAGWVSTARGHRLTCLWSSLSLHCCSPMTVTMMFSKNIYIFFFSKCHLSLILPGWSTHSAVPCMWRVLTRLSLVLLSSRDCWLHIPNLVCLPVPHQLILFAPWMVRYEWWQCTATAPSAAAVTWGQAQGSTKLHQKMASSGFL